MNKKIEISNSIPAWFLIGRLILILSLPYEGLKSYGDFWNFFNLASLGNPFFNLWVEFPPVFPFLSRGVYLMTGGRESAYVYTLVILFSLCQAISVHIFQRLAEKIYGGQGGRRRTTIYAFFLVGLFYGWAYFDSLAVLTLLAGIYLLIVDRNLLAGGVICLGGLLKWFPLIVLPATWKWKGPKKAVKVILIAMAGIIIVWGCLYVISPDLTRASISSQGLKGSWETIWALLDGNLNTGNFSSGIDRTSIQSAYASNANPAKIPSWITLLIFGLVGLIVFITVDINSETRMVAFVGATLLLLYLWSPGYSPQWMLYLLPIILLVFNERRSILLGTIILLVNLLEWPLLLSRGYFEYLEEIILLRTAVYVLVLLFLAGKLYLNQPTRIENAHKTI